MEVTGSLGRLIQGISQQPPAVRLEGQVSDMVNMIPDVVEGAKTRMGTTHIAKLTEDSTDNMAMHHYRRGDGEEEYFFIMKQGELPRIFDKLGRECGLTFEDNPLEYLKEATNPAQDMQFMTIADVTFVLNRKKPVRLRPDKTPAVGNTAIVYCAYGNYGTDYRIYINGEQAAIYTTPDGAEAAQIRNVRTEYIASKLYESITKWGKIGEYDVSRDGTSIYITRKDGSSDFSVSTDDGAKGKDLVAIKYKVSSTDLLPSRAPAGYKVQVWPTGSKPESRYWLIAEPKEGSLVTWKESMGANLDIGFDKNTMPYIIERLSFKDGIAQFRMGHGFWEDRKVGDDLTNPMPSFIEPDAPLPLGGMFMKQNRLCFTAGESVVSSRTSEFFDFFRFTAVSAMATDPFDVFSDADEVYTIRHVATLDSDTILFSESAQFALAGDKPLEKSNAILKPSGTFEVDTRVAPVASGEAIMFATSEGAYSSIREMYTDSYSDTKKAQPITSHVNRLLEGRITNMACSSSINRLLVTTEKHKNQIYCYDWIWQGVEKVQSAWHRWVFGDNDKVRGMFYSGSDLYLLIDRGAGICLEVMDLGDALEEGLQDRIRMDRQVDILWTYSFLEDAWVSNVLPFRPERLDMFEAVILDGWPEYVGGSFLFEYDAELNLLRTTFDLGDTNKAVTARMGLVYSTELEPTPVLIKDSQERVSYWDVPTVGLISLNMDKYPDFEVEVVNLQSGRTRTVLATNRLGGNRNNVVGYVHPVEGTFRFPLRAKSTTATYRIKVKSPHTFQLRDVEWIGSYNPRRRRV